MSDLRKNQDETFSAIDQEAASEAEKRDSRLLYQALSKNREVLGGQSAVPAEDRALSEKILADARSRSAEIAANQGDISARRAVSGAPIPLWLWLAWSVAIAALIAAWLYFR